MNSKSIKPKPTVPAFAAPKTRRASLTGMKRVATSVPPVATCYVCSGNVIETLKHYEDEHSGRHHMEADGFNCEKCGICYAFPPPKKTAILRGG